MWVCVIFCTVPSHFSWTSVFWIFLGNFTSHLAYASLITCTLEEVELSAYNGNVWLHCDEHLLWGTGWIKKFSHLLSNPTPPPPPILKTHVWSLKLRVENVMNRCFIILYKHRGWIKPPELVSLTIWGRFLLQRGRFSTKCQHQNTATVMGFRSRRNLQDGEVYWHYKWWWFLSLTPRAYKHSVLSRGAVSEMSDAPEASQCVLLMLMPPWQWLQKSPKDRLKTTCKVSALVAGY